MRDRVATVPIQRVDQAAFRATGKTQWLHIASIT